MDALALLREHEPDIKKWFGVAKIGIFGSNLSSKDVFYTAQNTIVFIYNSK